ncbi:FAD/NAD(P)-binding oxidoreductase [Candidatus Haliotispira prima]|uniref:FAD/NAD(P)-binding oxidoreductase n=1 Tax=Candidatus Haliotispira prima TaxID=3034016 RepID=A0ABY8MG01_9SPIO|nr:FAD/NAD(P)-binding oxidoreductase [Candidatus Haliotispira prima]
MEDQSRYLIIGAGIAGFTAAISIRSQSRKSSITLINGEAYQPYKRTNLSKFFATGFAPDDFTLATKEDLQKFYGIELVEETVIQVDYAKKLATAENGVYGYDYLILATGARYEFSPDFEPTKENSKLKFYRNKQETFALQEQLKSLQNIAVLGGGVQGVETCYELLKLGKQVSLIDPNDAPLARLKSPYISAYLRRDLEVRSVQCHWNQRIARFSGSMLEDFDLVICCFGTKPATELFPEDRVPQDNLLIGPDVFVCGDNLEYSGKGLERCTLWHEAMDLGQLAGLNAVRLAKGSAVEELAKVRRKPYRTKIEVADKVLFLAPSLEGVECRERHFLCDRGYYQFFSDWQGRLAGASLLCDERDLLKPLQDVVWEGMELRQACDILELPASCEFDGCFRPDENDRRV